ncbi:hypothetical protein JCM16106_17340 [Hydrogenophilus islandicus]
MKNSLNLISRIREKVLPQRRCVALFVAPTGNPLPPLPLLEAAASEDTTLLTPHFATDPHLALVAEVAPQRFARGDRLWLFSAAGQMVHIAWTRSDRWLDLTYELGHEARWPLPPAHMVVYDCYTLFAARGQGYYPRALRTLRALHTANTLWIYALTENRASISGIEKAGFTPRETLCRWRWLRFWLSPITPPQPMV